MGRTGLTWLLLTLSCLVQCVRSQDPATTKPSTTAPSTTVTITTTPAPVPSTTTTTTPSITTERQTTHAPTTTTIPTTTTTPTTTTPTTTIPTTTTAPTTTAPATTPTTTATPAPTAAPLNPSTIAQPTNPVPAGATDKPSTPSGGGGAAIITTVSKLDKTVTTSGPKSSSHSPLPPVTTGPSGPTLSTTNPVVTVPHQPVDKGTTTVNVTNVPAPATTMTGTTPSNTMTKHGGKDATGATAVVTSKSSANQSPGPISSTTPPTGPHIPHPHSTSKPTPGVTGRSSGSDHSTQSKNQATVPPTTTVITAAPTAKVFSYILNKGHQSEEKELVVLCQRLMASLEDGNCTISYRHHNDKVLFDSVEITGKVKTNIVTQLYDDATKKPTDNRTLITILASCGALLIMIIILAVCASHHRKPYNETQMHLTEELQTMENGYHDNPTLEVMEVGADMQEKKPPLSLHNGGEFNDSWIVPIDNLLKEEGPDEEDTHL